ncbi:MAG: hypothetical protein DPW13_16725 [Planctomycetes bacterium]|nr:hypothetical protein [Planctomycetota bacterium]
MNNWLLLLIAGGFIAAFAYADRFKWTGQGGTSNWNDNVNWNNLDGTEGYPGADSEADEVTIDDTSPRGTATVNIMLPGTPPTSLFLGNDHTLELNEDLTVHLDPDGEPGLGEPGTFGVVECEGEVTLSGSKTLVTDYVIVNTDQDTVITVSGSATLVGG